MELLDRAKFKTIWDQTLGRTIASMNEEGCVCTNGMSDLTIQRYESALSLSDASFIALVEEGKL